VSPASDKRELGPYGPLQLTFAACLSLPSKSVAKKGTVRSRLRTGGSNDQVPASGGQKDSGSFQRQLPAIQVLYEITFLK